MPPLYSPMAGHIRRTFRPGAALPQTTQSALFTITGGPILVYNIVGEVTTAIQNQANNTQLVFNHATASDVDLCADLNIANDAVGELYGITGTFADAMVSGFALPATIMPHPLILSEGTLDLDCAASNTGAIAWTLFWLPFDDAGTYVATA
jgi:hypothetical protein